MHGSCAKEIQAPGPPCGSGRFQARPQRKQHAIGPCLNPNTLLSAKALGISHMQRTEWHIKCSSSTCFAALSVFRSMTLASVVSLRTVKLRELKQERRCGGCVLWCVEYPSDTARPFRTHAHTHTYSHTHTHTHRAPTYKYTHTHTRAPNREPSPPKNVCATTYFLCACTQKSSRASKGGVG